MTQRKRRGKPVVIASGEYVRLVNDNGWEFAERVNASGVVAIVALTRDNEMLFVEQFRPAIRRRVIEIPAGLAGDIPGQETEAFAKAARRELLEETGYRAHKLEHLFCGPASAGMSGEMVDFYLARNVRRVGDGGGDDREDIRVHVVPLEQAATWLRKKDTARRCIDPKAYVGLLFAIAAVSGSS